MSRIAERDLLGIYEILRSFLSLTLSDYSLDNVVVGQDNDSLDSSFFNFRQLNFV